MNRNMMRDSFRLLQKRGHKLTEPRRRIIETLYSQQRAFTALELHQQVADRGVSLASVYRTLELLVALGLAETATRTGDEQHYVACSPEHHHHVICTGCGRVADVTECLLESFETFVGEQTGFTIESHMVEFRGMCAACKR